LITNYAAAFAWETSARPSAIMRSTVGVDSPVISVVFLMVMVMGRSAGSAARGLF